MKIGSKVIAVLTVAFMLFGNFVITPNASACNEHDAGYIGIHKVDADNAGINLAGAKFKIQRKVDGSWRDFIKGVYNDGTSEPTMTTGADGTAKSGLVYEGVYRVVETDAPVGYELNPRPSEEIAVTRAMFGQVTWLCAKLTNKKEVSYGSVTISKDVIGSFSGSFTFTFKITKKDDPAISFTGTVTNEGTCTINNVPCGIYTLQEINVPDGFSFNSFVMNGKTVTEINVSSSGTTAAKCPPPSYTVVCKNDARAKIRITKDDTHGKMLAGAKFELYKLVDGKWVKQTGVYTSNASGVCQIDNLELGKYKVEEIEAPFGYAGSTVNPGEKNLDVPNETETFAFHNCPKVGSIKIIKNVTKLDDGEGIPSFKVKLEGPTDNANVASATKEYTINRGDNTIGNLAFGTYKITEIEIPNGFNKDYTISANTFKIDDSHQNNITVTIDNMKLYGSAKFLKAVDGVDGDTTVFTLRVKKDGAFYADVSVSEASPAAELKNMPFGNYTVEEINIDGKYVPVGISKPSFTVGYDNYSAAIEVTATNALKKGKVQFIKDVNNVENDGTDFTLSVQGVGHSFSRTVTLDELKSVTWDSIPLGTYKVEEINVPAGYEKVKLQVGDALTDTFTVTADNYATLVVVKATNARQFGRVKFIKDVSNVESDAAEFELTVKKADGSVYKTVTVSEKAPVLWTDLPLGAYTVEETNVPAGYEKVSLTVDGAAVNSFTVTADNHDKLVEVKATNKKQQAKIVFSKIVTNVAGDTTEFKINILKDGKVIDTATVSQAKTDTKYLPLGAYTVEEVAVSGYRTVSVTPPSFEVRADNYTTEVQVQATNEKLFGAVTVKKILTNETNGKAQFTVRITGSGTAAGYTNDIVVTTAGVVSSTQPLDKLPLGSYAVQELAAPGYNRVSLTPETFTIKADNYTTAVAIEAKNEKQLGKVRIIKDVDNIDNDPAEFTFTIKQGTTVVKTIEHVTELASVQFELPLGTYTVEEAAHKGYSLVGKITPETFTITADNYTKTIEVKAVNHKLFGSVEILKDVNNVTGDPTEFEFDFQLDGLTVKTVKVVEGTPTLVDNLPVGEYKVVEKLNGSYSTVSITPSTFSVTESNYHTLIKVNAINSIHEGKVTVKKDVTNVVNDPTQFTVRITGSGTAAGYLNNVVVNEAGVVSSTASLDKLPLGHYKVEEIYTGAEYVKNGIAIQIGTNPAITTGEFDLTAANYTAAITITANNAKVFGSAKFLKVVDNAEGDTTKFTLRLTRNGAFYRDIEVSEADGEKLVSDLDFGSYAVTEILNGSAYTNLGLEVTVGGVKQAKNEFIISAGTLAAEIKVTATNHRQNNAVTLEKVVNNAGGDATRFTINITDGKSYNHDIQISDADGVVGSSAHAFLADLPFGTYTVTETVVPAGYDKVGIRVNGADINTFTIDDTSYGKTIAIVATNSKRMGQVSLQKIVDNAVGDSADFDIRIQGAGYDNTVKLSQADGVVDGSTYSFLKNLPYGTYTVSEGLSNTEFEPVDIKINGVAGTTFTIDGTNYTAKIAITVTNHKRMGGAQFVKDVDNVANDPAEFTLNVYDSGKKLVGTVKVNETGTAQTIKDLPFGAYTVEEAAVAGYETVKIENGSFTISDATYSAPVQVKAINHKKLGWVSFAKSIDNDPDDTTEFTLEVKGDNGFAGTVTVGQGLTGSRINGLPYGHYTVTEIPVDGYTNLSITPNEFDINDATYSVMTEYVPCLSIAAVNHKHMGNIQITKQDAANPSLFLAGAEFTVTDIDGIVKDTLTTDNTGKAVSKDLPVGTYWVKETKAPGGYIIDNTSAVEVVLPADKSLELLTFTDSKDEGSLVIRKLSSLNDSPVAGVQFQVSTRSDFAAGSLLMLPNDGKTDANGEVRLQHLETGLTLYVREIKQAPGYDIDVTLVKNVTVVLGQASIVIFKNNPVGTVQLTKVDAVNPTVKLAGAVFCIYSDAACTKLVQTLAATDANGLTVSPELPFGATTVYYVKEITAPAGYLLNTQVQQAKFTAPGQIVALTFTNTKTTGSLTILKVDALDTTKKLAGATFQLYADAALTTKIGAPVTTGADGLATWTNLAAGTYWVLETAAPTDYELPTVAIDVTVTAGMAAPEAFVIKNQYNPPEDIQTGMMDWNVLIVGAVVLLAGIGIVIFTRKRSASRHAKK